MAEVMQHDTHEDGENKQNTNQYRTDTLTPLPVNQRNPSDNQKKGEMHVYVDAGEFSDFYGPFHGNTSCQRLYSPVGRHIHSPCIDSLHPVGRIDVDAQLPPVDFVRIDTRQKGEINRNHEPLDIVGSGMLDGLGYDAAQAVHAGVGCPLITEEGGCGQNDSWIHMPACGPIRIRVYIHASLESVV